MNGGQGARAGTAGTYAEVLEGRRDPRAEAQGSHGRIQEDRSARQEALGRLNGPNDGSALAADPLALGALGVPARARDLVVRLDVVAQRAARLIVVPVSTRQLGVEGRNLHGFSSSLRVFRTDPAATGLRQTGVSKKDEALAGWRRSARGRRLRFGGVLLVAGDGPGCYLDRLQPSSSRLGHGLREQGVEHRTVHLAAVVAPCVLVQIALEPLVRHRVVRATNAVLEQPEEPFDGELSLDRRTYVRVEHTFL
jgi:hypothetical protein